MRRHIRSFSTRHEPRGHFLAHMKSGAGAMIGMAAIGGLSVMTELPLLIAPLGATAVLLFGQPASPLSQPVNVFGGYFLAAAVGVGAVQLFPGAWWAATIAVGVVIAAMLALRVTHPPAGAIPLIASAAPLQPGVLLGAVAIGSASLVALAFLHHRIPPRHDYPRRPME